MGTYPVLPLYGVYISHYSICYLVSSLVTDFHARNKILTGKLLHQGYRYHELRKTSSKSYRRHYELVSKFEVGLISLATGPIGTRMLC